MPLKIVFLGSDPIALPALEWIAGEGSGVASLIAVVTQPDRPSGRGQAVAANAIKVWAHGRGIPVHQPAKLSDADVAWMSALAPDLTLVMAYGQILRENFIAAPRLGTVNLHASILPRYRGASPIQSAIAAGERVTGVSLMRIVRRLDAGPVADSEQVAIGPLDTALDAESRIAAACIPLLARSLPRLARGELEFREQDEAQSTHCRKLAKADGLLDFSAPAAALAARINGFFPWPGCTIELKGQAIRLGLADVGTSPAPGVAPPGRMEPGTPAPGAVLGADPEGLLVATGAGVLRLRRLQRPGGRMLPAGPFLLGFPIPPGDVIASHTMTAIGM